MFKKLIIILLLISQELIFASNLQRPSTEHAKKSRFASICGKLCCVYDSKRLSRFSCREDEKTYCICYCFFCFCCECCNYPRICSDQNDINRALGMYPGLYRTDQPKTAEPRTTATRTSVPRITATQEELI